MYRILRYSIILFVFIAGCGALERFTTGVSGRLTYKCAKSGVEYVQSDSGLAVHVDLNGKPVKCDRWKGYE